MASPIMVLKSSEREAFEVEEYVPDMASHKTIEDDCRPIYAPATMVSPIMVLKSSEREAFEVEEYVPDMASRKAIEDDWANIVIPISNVSSRFPYNRHVAGAKSSSAEGGDRKSSNDVLKSVEPEFVKDYQMTLPNLTSEPLQDRGLQLLIFRILEIMFLIFFAFSYGILYLTTGHRFVEQREKFVEIYRKYSRSHFIMALEVMVLLTACQIYGSAGQNSKAFLVFSFSMWFIVISWLYAPFLLNPSGFESSEVVEDWNNWCYWMSYRGSIYANKSWESWWGEEQEHLLNTGFIGRFWKIFFHLRFFVYQYVLMYQLHVANIDQSIIGYGLLWSWPVIIVAMIILKIVSMIMKKFNMDMQLMCSLFELSLFIFGHFFCIIMFHCLTMDEICSCLLVFLPTGWGLLQIAEACRPFVEGLGMWGMVKAVASGYDFLMGMLIFSPVVILVNFPWVSELQAAMLLDFKSKLSANAFRLSAFLPPV